jgi:hypothetical protein
MSAPILASVTTGNKTVVGQRLVVAGSEKMGKTTLACGAPNALLVPCEMDSPALARYRHTKVLTSFDEVEQLCSELIAEAQRGNIPPGSTIVWDSGTAIEKFIHTAVLKEDQNYVKAYDKNGVLKPNAKAVTMESALGGYGKAYLRANELFDRWLRQLDQLAFYGGINAVITCHVFAARVNDPASGEYDTWDLLLHSPKNQKTYGKREILTQWADFVGFLHEPMFVMKAGEGERMNRAISQNQGRVIGVDRTPGWVAGNRYGMTGVVPIPEVQGWNHLADAIYKSTNGNVDLYNRNA